MTQQFDINIFKEACFEVESFTKRNWIVLNFEGYLYPNSYYKCSYINKREGTIVQLLCNSQYPIFAIADTFGDVIHAIPGNFIWIANMATSIKNSMEMRSIKFEFLSPKILSLEFYNKSDYEEKITNIPLDRINLTLKVLNLEKWNYRLFYGQNVGYNLYNSEED